MYFWSTTGEVDLDFIEIGTSYFDTLIEKASDETYGISIEPLKVYLDRLPNKKNVLKINCAISKNNKETEDYIYYIKPEFITEEWMAGSNLIGDFHPLHKKLNLTHLVDSQKIKLIPLEKILTENKIRKINFLKIDTEGFDSFIVESLLPYLKSKNNIDLRKYNLKLMNEAILKM
jgi:hypothetical protein